MADRKLFAGHAVRRLRRGAGLTQAAMAEVLTISPSYLNLVEKNQRPLSASLLVKLAETFDFDPRALAAGEPGGGEAALRRRLADPMFADLEIDRNEIEEWLAGAPGGAEAFARAFDRIRAGGTPDDPAAVDPISEVRREIERWRGHFPDLDAAAEALADELRMGAGDLYGAISERLRVKHQLTIRVLPVDVMPELLRRTDLHARQVQLSEVLDPASRTFAVAVQLAQIEARDEIEALAKGAGFADRAAERLYRRHLANYYAAALMMPYARFLRACEATGYDIELLQRRFGAGFEQVAHRMTALNVSAHVGCRSSWCGSTGRGRRRSVSRARARRRLPRRRHAVRSGGSTPHLNARERSRCNWWRWRTVRAGSRLRAPSPRKGGGMGRYPRSSSSGSALPPRTQARLPRRAASI